MNSTPQPSHIKPQEYERVFEHYGELVKKYPDLPPKVEEVPTFLSKREDRRPRRPPINAASLPPDLR